MKSTYDLARCGSGGWSTSAVAAAWWRTPFCALASLAVFLTAAQAAEDDNEEKIPPWPREVAELARRYAGVTEWRGFLMGRPQDRVRGGSIFMGASRRKRWCDGPGRLAFVSPEGGTVSSVDPIALMRGAKNRAPAEAFIEYVLSMEGQKLWNLKPGTPGGPERFALRRLPVRRDFYRDESLTPLRSDPAETPFVASEQLVYRAAWTGGLFREMSFVIRVMCLDTHQELTSAWRAIVAAGKPPEAMAALQDLARVDYAAAGGRIREALTSKNKADEIRLAKALGDAFREQYARAEALAKAGR